MQERSDGSSLLDLEAGWRRVKLDLLKKRGFVRHPYQHALIAVDEATWLEQIRRSLANGTYVPGQMDVCDVPKSGGAVRPGSILHLDDAVVYSACVDAAYAAIFGRVSNSKQLRDFAYRLREPNDRDGWFLDRFTGWKNFDRAAISRIQSGAQWVVVADIAGYFEHIDLQTLFSDLRAIGVDSRVLAQLSTLLNAWTQVAGRGIPQGQSPSDVLGKLYLASVDDNLTSHGFDHIRYVDDIRIFCADIASARKAVLVLSSLLRARGLSVQAAKLDFMRADKAQEKFEGVRSVVVNLVRTYSEALNVAVGADLPSMSVAEAEEFLESADVDDFPTEVLQRVWSTHFEEDSVGFNGTLFRFLLGRLGRAKDRFAAPRVLDFLRTHPDQTSFIIKYLAKSDQLLVVAPELAQFLQSPEAVYDYQFYEIIDGILDAGAELGGPMAAVIHDAAFDRSRPPYLRAAARCYVGKFGSQSDLERLQGQFAQEGTPLARAEIICALQRMEPGKRNSFYKRVGSGDLPSRAVAWASRKP